MSDLKEKDQDQDRINAGADDPRESEDGGREKEITDSGNEVNEVLVNGEVFDKWPQDLFIPPDALEVFLETFQGPLDLLLYLIRRHNLDILDIPIAEITRQYMSYIGLLNEQQFELAAEYLVMAAILAEIKSRMLLPRPTSDDGDESDPRAELVRRLQEYERFKQAAEDLDELPRMGRDFAQTEAYVEDKSVVKLPPKVELREILAALKDVMGRAELFTSHHISGEPLSVRERMSRIMSALRDNPYMEFHHLFDPEEGRMGIVVSFLALMELTREQLVDLVQHEPFGQIYVKSPE